MDRYGVDYLNGCIISSLTTTEMILTGGYGSKYRLVSIPNESGSGNTNSQSSESLYFTNFTFTASTSSVTVKFFTNVKATSATIKYGKNSATSSVSTTIIDKQISATITGLTKGTKYYVKCIARNANGSVTSDEYPVITNY